MPAQLDVYRDWLGIPDKERPLDFYTLLRLKRFEDDPVRVRAHYRKLNAHVRKYASGEFASQSQELLNELAKAMLCLTDTRRKSEYDASLGRTDAGAGKRRSLEQILLLRKVVDREQLDKARKFADAVGLDMHEALVQQKMVKPEIVMQVYAESQGVPYIELADLGLDLELVPKVPAILARQHSCVPVMMTDGQVIMASPHPLSPDAEEELRLRLGAPVRSALCTSASINTVIAQHYPKEAAMAERAAGTVGGAKAEAAAAGKAGAEAVDPAVLAERKKQQRNVALITLNFGTMATVFYLQFFKAPVPSMGYSIGLGLAIGVPLAATAWVVMGMRKS